jgi:hypothetical protein
MATVAKQGAKAASKPVRVRVDGAVQTAYLLKVPESIYQRCCDAEAGEHIADIEVAGAVPVRLHVAAYTRKAAGAAGAAEEVEEPMTCEIRPQPGQCDPTYALAETPGAMSLLGRVSASGTAMRDAKRELLQKRGISESKRSVLAFEGGDGPALKRVTAAAAPIRELREKLAPDVLKRTLLSLFTLERPCWTMTELAAETKQPREHLSQMLQQICTYNDAGENRFTFELIAKYRA